MALHGFHLLRLALAHLELLQQSIHDGHAHRKAFFGQASGDLTPRQIRPTHPVSHGVTRRVTVDHGNKTLEKLRGASASKTAVTSPLFYEYGLAAIPED